MTRLSPTSVKVKLNNRGAVSPGAFRLSYLMDGDGVNATLLAYPESDKDGGYFLLYGGLPAHEENDKAKTVLRELTLVLDRSGSMSGEKIEQVREAAKQIIAALKPGEAFNIITYSDNITSFSATPVIKDATTEADARKFLEEVTAVGGTNIHAALTQALAQKPTADMLPIVLFLTDGLPTVGNTSEVAIRELATKSNPHERRVFTFGVGADVNAPLLDKLASASRAMATYVLPGEDVEVKVASVYRGLKGPVLTDPVLEAVASGAPRVDDVLPATLNDVYEGGQFVVLGKFKGNGPLKFRLTGKYRGEAKNFEFEFPLDGATVTNAFVPRLWASRKIGVLVDAIAQMGGGEQVAENDPRMRELVDEIVRLGTKYGILTEYTAFLAREGTDLSERDEVVATAVKKLKDRAIEDRTGLAGINQASNSAYMRAQTCANPANEWYDDNMQRVTVTNVQQVCDLAFYHRNGRWVDSRVVNEESKIEPKRVIEFGSKEFLDLARELANEGRAGAISLQGDILLVVNGEPVLIRSGEKTEPEEVANATGSGDN